MSRYLLLAACASAPLLVFATCASAQTAVTTARTTPIATSTAGDVDVSSAGSIVAATATPLITLDSSNALTIEGAISARNTDNATGVLILGGNTGSLTNTGSITLGEDYTPTDSVNGDGVFEAPFATGTGKAGVRLVGSSPFTGNLLLGGAGIAVSGNNSYGVSLEGPLNGSVTSTAPISVTGDSTTGLRTLAPVSGSISLGSRVTAVGAGTRAIDLESTTGGSLGLYGSVTSTAYSLTTRSTVSTTLAKIQATALDVQQSGATVTVGANVAGGVFLAAAPSGTVAGTLADVDGDGVADGVEGTGTIASFGAAPGLLIGATGRSVTLGAFGTGDNAYGLIIRGSVTGNGIYDGVTATALQIGSGGTASLAGGVRIVGTVLASTYEADATAAHVTAGSSVPTFRNEGLLSAAINDSSLTTGYGAGSARALLIDAGAHLATLTNSGTIAANAIGNTGTSAAVIDLSGTLSTIVNSGTISALRPASDAASAITGSNLALDLRANTTGVSIVQQLNTNLTTVYGSTSGTTDTASTTATATVPSIVGDVLLGSGPNSVSLLAGTLTGTLDLGSGAASLTLDNAATYFGTLRYSGSQLALAVPNGTLTTLSTATLQLSTLAVGSSGTLNLTVDPANSRASLLQVSGAATLLSGAKIGVNLASAVTSLQTFTLISSPLLSVGSSDAALLATSSLLISASLHTDTTAGTITVSLSPRSPADLGLNASEGNGLAAISVGVGRDSAVAAALLGAQDVATFGTLYRQLLPSAGSGTFLAIDQASRTIADLTTEHSDTFGRGATSGVAWLQQFLFGVRDDRGVAQGSETAGFGIVGGLETSDSDLGAFGVTAAYVDGSSNDPTQTSGQTTFTQAEGGVNWRAGIGPIDLAARVGGSYLWGDTRRSFNAAAGELTAAVSRTTKGVWNGWTADARFTASHRFDFRHAFLQPQLKLDYVRFDQDAYTERFGGAGVNLAVASRSSYAASTTASVIFGGKFGETGAVRPTLELGVRDVFQGDAGAVSAAFASGGSSFTLAANPITGAGALARVGLKYAGSTFDVELAAKAEAFKNYQSGDLKLAVTTRF